MLRNTCTSVIILLGLISTLLSICTAYNTNPIIPPENNSSQFVKKDSGGQQNSKDPISSSSSIKKEANRIMRAWTCHGRNQRQLVDNLTSAGIIKSQIIRDVMNNVDRANYVFGGHSSNAYDDTPLGIGHGQTISAPHMHAHVLEELLPPLLIHASEHPNDPVSILDVGCGSGYLTTCFGRLLSNKKDDEQPPLGIRGKVWGIDFVPELVEMSKYNTKKADGDLLESGTVTLLKGDGWKGLPDAAPFQAIHVGAAADTFPKNLMMQLAVGGVMIIPVGPQLGGQALYRVERVKESPTFDTSDFVMTQLLGVRYVPLVHASN
mmetsp:Transcript_6213/g.9067  ORF Transcript_6213/g.9067 Transcript_6213/m.9067 type:complete len:321 (-) Transcript_6213:144-1106(-)